MGGSTHIPDQLMPEQLQSRWEELRHLVPGLGPQVGAAACVYVLRGARQTAPRRWKQGSRTPPDCPGLTEPAAQWLAERHVYRVEQHVAAGLLAWTRNERRLIALAHIPTPQQVLALQAIGWRCVSLLADDADCGLQPSPFEFALHDLCHAEHFFDPAHHVAQVGFFAGLHRLGGAGAAEGGDQLWQADWNHVAADMNGSVLFLFSALRRKAQLLAARQNRPAPEVLAPLWTALGLTDQARETAERFSVHKDVPRSQVEQDAALLTAHFAALGKAALAKAADADPLAVLGVVPGRSP